MKFIIELLGIIFVSSIQIYSWHKIINRKLVFNHKLFISIMFLSIYSIISFYNINVLLKDAFMLIVDIVLCMYLFKISFKKSIILSSIDYIFLILCDAVFGLIFLIISATPFNTLWQQNNGKFIPNISIGIIIILIINIKPIVKVFNKAYNFIEKHTINLKELEILIYFMIIISCSIAAFVITYYHNNILISIVINIFVSLIYLIIIIRIIKTKNKLISINSKYNTSIDNLQAQETIINEYRIMNHENKNNLLTIKGMTNNKKVIGYINSLLQKKNDMNNKIINDTLKLPEGGIRGLIYSKMLIMHEHDIKCNLNVDKSIKTKILSNISDNDVVDICQIIGVFIDNAIDESLELNKKEININLHYCENKMSIIITNYHNKIINGNSELKTTKGKGHGYGLQLVKRIVNNNKRLHNNVEITKDTFTQNLEIII